MINPSKAFLIALSLILFAGFGANGAGAEDSAAGPDTPVSSDAVQSTNDVPLSQGAISNPAGNEAGSQEKRTVTAANSQEAKDRLFVDVTFIAAAVFMCVIAIFLFLSLPKQPKKAGTDNQ